MICGKEAQLCCPLTFCDECRNTPKADEMRYQHEKWFEDIVKKRDEVNKK